MAFVARASIEEQLVQGEIVGDQFLPYRGCIFRDPELVGTGYPVAGLEFDVPADPGRVIAVMDGFRRPGTTQAAPRWVPKAVSYVSPTGATIPYYAFLTKPIWSEAELAVVVGRALSRATAAEASEAIYGWTCFNDVTAIEIVDGGDCSMSKALDGYAVMGPCINTSITEEHVMDGLEITSRVNGRETQRGNTRRYRWRPSEMLSHISHRIALRAGDVVTLGTPPMPSEVVVGDTVECEVEQIGALANTVVASDRHVDETDERLVGR